MEARAHHINPGPHEKRGMRSSARVGLGEDHIYAFLMHKYSGKKWAWAKTIVKLHGPATAAHSRLAEFPNVAINQELEEPLQRNASKCNFFYT